MPIELTQQALTLSDVSSVVVTPVVQDEATGEYVRELRIFGGDGEPVAPIQGIDAPAPGQGRLLVTLRLTTTDRARIAISVPSSEF